MEAIHIITRDRAGQTFRIAIYHDADAPNPLEDWDDIGSILSLNRRHAAFDPDGIEAALASNPDAVALAYFEHGLCRWSLAGELPAGCHCPWDSTAFAGLWLPDAGTLEAACNYGGSTRRHFMRKRARQACDVYTDWCNGEVYGYAVSRVMACPCCDSGHAEPVESCWGFYGMEDCVSAAEAAIVDGERPHESDRTSRDPFS